MKRVITVLAVIMLVCAFAGPQAFAAGEKAKDAAAGQQAMIPGQSYMASNLIDYKVKNQMGQELGEVEDIIISQNGQVQYLLISHGGVLDIGDKLVPVPMNIARVNAAENVIVLQDVDKSKLEQAPAFTKDEWQQRAADAQIERDVYGYYGQEVPRGDMQMQRTPAGTTELERTPGTPIPGRPAVGMEQQKEPGKSEMERLPGGTRVR